MKFRFKIKINWKKLFEGIKYYSHGLYSKFTKDHIWIMSAGIAFDLILCAIPFTLIVFSIIGTYLAFTVTDTNKAINDYLETLVGISPEVKDKIKNLVLSKLGELTNYKTITGIIGVIGILWSASGLFSTIRDVLNKIYKTHFEPEYFWGKFKNYLSDKVKDVGMVFMTIILFILSFSSTFIVSLLKAIDEIMFKNALWSLGYTEKIVSIGLGVLFTFLMFYVIFKLVPYGRMNTRICLISSITTAILYELLKSLFTFYIIYLSDVTLYGTYATIVSVILWIYYSSLTIILGAEVGQLYHERKLLKGS